MKIETLILKAILFFNILTWVLYILSPLSIHSDYHTLNIIYVAINIFMMKIGFKAGEKINNAKLQKEYRNKINTRTFYFIFFFYIFTFLLRYAYILFLPPFDIGALVNRVLVGIADPYIGRHIIHGGRTLPWSLFFIISIIDSVFFIFALLNFRNQKITIKIIIILLMIIECLFWMGSGTNFGIIMLLSSLILAIFMQAKELRLSTFKVVHYVVLGLCALFVALLIFSYNMEGRSGGDFEKVTANSLALGTSVNIDEESPLLIWLPYRFQMLMLFVTSYLTQGYMFLENIYELDFHWGCFFGNNPALQSIATDFLGFNPEINSYQLQMEQYGVDSYINWHSCYLWLANDFTIIGVPFVIFYISKLASSALLIYRCTKDVITGVIFVILANILLFLFANNNYLSSVCYSFIFIFPFWYKTRYIYYKRL